MNKILLDDFKRLSPYLPDKEKLKGTRWLITGTTGMICSYFMAFLCWLNETELDGTLHVTALQRRAPDPSDPNNGFLTGKSYVKFRTADLGKEWRPEDEEFDYIFHGATSAAPRAYMADPVGTINVNVKTTQALLEHAVTDKRLKALVYLSSGEIYGTPSIEDVPTKEEYCGVTDHLGSRSCYVESKRFAETLCMNYFRQYNVPVQIIRPIQLFGPGYRENDSRAWVEFIVKGMRGEQIEILGDGTARRAYCYLADAVTQIFAVLQRGEIGAVYNIGSEEHLSIRELADMIASLGTPPVEVVVRNKLPDYLKSSPQISCPSIARVAALATLLHTPIRDGLRNSIDWLKEVRG